MRTWIMSLLGLGKNRDAQVAYEKVNEQATDKAAENPINVDQLVTMAMSTSPDEIDCEEFFEQLDRFVELGLNGRDVATLMPLMQGHLERCGDCREEYEALQRAVQVVP